MNTTRRHFARTAFASTVLSSSFGGFAAEAPSNRVRLVMMGVGGRGFAVMRHAADVPGVEIATIVDVDEIALRKAAEEIRRKTGKMPAMEKDIRRALESKDIDGVICCTPDHWHALAAAMAMRAGKAIYVEKPCSFCPAEGERLVQIQRETGAVFQMGNQRRASEAYVEAVAALRTGIIGEPRWAKCWYMRRRKPIGRGRPVAPPATLDWDMWQGPAPRTAYLDNILPYNWHWFRRWGTGEAGNNSPHFLDVARWAMGLRFPSRVTCGGGRLFHAGDDWAWPDTMNASFEFPGRKLVTWEGNSAVSGCSYRNHSSGCMVYGLEGSMHFSANNDVILFDQKGKEVRRWGKDKYADASQKISLTDPFVDLDMRHLGRFADCIRARDTNTNSPAEEAHASTLLAHLANIAAITGETVKLDSSTGRLAAGSPGAELWSRDYEKGWTV